MDPSHHGAPLPRRRQPQPPVCHGERQQARPRRHAARRRQPQRRGERTEHGVRDHPGLRPLSAGDREHPGLVGLHGLHPTIRRIDDHRSRDAQSRHGSAHALDHQVELWAQPGLPAAHQQHGRQRRGAHQRLLLPRPHADRQRVGLLLRSSQHARPPVGGRGRHSRLRRRPERTTLRPTPTSLHFGRLA